MTAEAGWLDAGDGYSLSIIDSKIVCMNKKGNELKSVPSKVKKTEVHQQLKLMTEYLTEHARECKETADQWMLRSLPVPREILQGVWDDVAWRHPLENAIVAPPDFLESGDDESIGFLRGADPKKGVGIVNLDGETVWIDTPSVVLPHPVLLEELEDFRELATELGITQGLSQLFRETFTRSADLKDSAKSINQFADGKFEQLNWALSKCRQLGYPVRGGYATCAVWEDGVQAEARYWIGSDYPEYETFTGELMWVDARERSLSLGNVGPVAFSEGMRMASSIYAARSKEENEE